MRLLLNAAGFFLAILAPTAAVVVAAEGPSAAAPPETGAVPRFIRDGTSIGTAIVITDPLEVVDQLEDEFIKTVCGEKLRDWRIYYRRVIEAGGHLYHETTVLLSPSFERRIFYFDVTVPLAPVIEEQTASD